MPINGIETAYKDRYTFAPLSQRADSVVHFASAIYIAISIGRGRFYLDVLRRCQAVISTISDCMRFS